MEFLDGIQQFRVHTGSHKGTAVFAGRLCQPGILAIEAPSKYPIIAIRFGSIGSFHGIPQSWWNDDTKEHRRTGFKRIFGYFGRSVQDRRRSMAGRKSASKT
jgi:hypothetical protein